MEDRIDLLDALLLHGIGKRFTSHQDVSYLSQSCEELKQELDQERETRDLAVRQIDSFLSSAAHTDTHTNTHTNTHTGTHTQVVFSERECFRLFAELFVRLVESCRYEVDSLRRLYRLAHSFLLRIPTHTAQQVSLSLKSLLTGLHIWQNQPFWVDCVHDLVRHDLLAVEKLFSLHNAAAAAAAAVGGNNNPNNNNNNSKNNSNNNNNNKNNNRKKSLFLGLSKAEVSLSLLCTRTQAVAASMRSLGLHKETVDAFFCAVQQKYKLEDAQLDMHTLSLTRRADEILDSVLALTTDTNTPNEREPSSLHTRFTHAQNALFAQEIAQATSARARKKFSLSHCGFSDVLCVQDIGYSTVISLFLTPPLLTLASQTQLTQPTQPTQPTQQPVPSKIPRTPHNVTENSRVCVCGERLSAWRVLGLPSVAELSLWRRLGVSPPLCERLSHAHRLPEVLCERCFRTLTPADNTFPETSFAEITLAPSPFTVKGWGAAISVSERDRQGEGDEGEGEKQKEKDVLRRKCEAVEKALHRIFPDLDSQINVNNNNNNNNASPAVATKTVNDRERLHERELSENSARGSVQSDERETRGGARNENYRSRPLPSLPSSEKTRDSNESAAETEKPRSSESVTYVSERPSDLSSDLVPLTHSEFQDFMRRLWRGTTVHIVYSMSPFVEKTRLLFLRSDSAASNEVLVERLKKPSSASPVIEWLQRHCMHGNVPSLFLGWAHRSDATNLQLDTSKCVSLQTVSHVRLGAQKYQHCLKITSETKTIVIKVEDEEKLQTLARGLTQLASIMSPHFRPF